MNDMPHNVRWPRRPAPETQEEQEGVARAAIELEQELRKVTKPQHYAPLSTRITAAMMEGGAEIEEKISAAITEVNRAVDETLNDLQKQIDELRATTSASADAARLALENNIAIASRALQSASIIRKQVAEFRSQVERATATPDVTAEDKSE